MDPVDPALIDQLRALRSAPNAGFIHLSKQCPVDKIDIMHLYTYTCTCENGGDVFQTVVDGVQIQDKTRKNIYFQTTIPQGINIPIFIYTFHTYSNPLDLDLTPFRRSPSLLLFLVAMTKTSMATSIYAMTNAKIIFLYSLLCRMTPNSVFISEIPTRHTIVPSLITLVTCSSVAAISSTAALHIPPSTYVSITTLIIAL
jgi:hypothetical protein